MDVANEDALMNLHIPNAIPLVYSFAPGGSRKPQSKRCVRGNSECACGCVRGNSECACVCVCVLTLFATHCMQARCDRKHAHQRTHAHPSLPLLLRYLAEAHDVQCA